MRPSEMGWVGAWFEHFQGAKLTPESLMGSQFVCFQIWFGVLIGNPRPRMPSHSNESGVVVGIPYKNPNCLLLMSSSWFRGDDCILFFFFFSGGLRSVQGMLRRFSHENPNRWPSDDLESQITPSMVCLMTLPGVSSKTSILFAGHFFYRNQFFERFGKNPSDLNWRSMWNAWFGFFCSSTWSAQILTNQVSETHPLPSLFSRWNGLFFQTKWDLRLFGQVFFFLFCCEWRLTFSTLKSHLTWMAHGTMIWEELDHFFDLTALPLVVSRVGGIGRFGHHWWVKPPIWYPGRWRQPKRYKNQ